MNPKKILSEWFIITFGTVVAASAVFFFLIPSHLAVGSISGLAIILANYTAENIRDYDGAECRSAGGRLDFYRT